MARPLAAALVAELSRAGVDTLFGLPGGGPNLDKVGAAHDAEIRFVLMHGETAACIAAGTYGLLTGTVGVAIGTRGPGVSSAVNGVAQATLDRHPLLYVADTVPAAIRGRVPHQRLDQPAVMRPVAKWAGTLGSERPGEVAAAALALAATRPPGAVHLDFDPTAPGDPPPPVPPPAGPPPDDDVAAAVALLAGAERPVVVAGGEAIPWTRELRTFAAAAGCPVLATYHAKGIVADGGPHAAGLFTNGALERPLLEAADLVVTAGLDPVEPIPQAWEYVQPVLAIHPWRPADRYLEPAVELIGPVGPILDRLAPHATSTWPPAAGAAARERARAALAADAAGLSPHDVVAATQEWASSGATVTVDAGAHFLVVMPMWEAAEPRRVLISNGLATMGFAVPAAIGAALARPGAPVICFVGDGGLGMALAELETIARLGLPITIVVLNDAALSLIAVKQRPDQGGTAATRYAATDFAAVARGFGIPAAVASTAEELRAALGPGPRLVDCRVDPAPYRHVIRATRGPDAAP